MFNIPELRAIFGKFLPLIAAILFLPQSVLGAPIIDQSYLVADDETRPGIPVTQAFIINRFAAQSLTVGLAGLLTQIDLQIGGEESYPMTLEIGLGSDPNTDTVVGTFNLIAPDWGVLPIYTITSVDVSSALINVLPGQNLVLSLYSSSQVFGGWALGIIAVDGTYVPGQAYQAQGQAPIFFPAFKQDLGFQTWVDTNPVQVPEPIPIALIGIGLIGLVVARKRKW